MTDQANDDVNADVVDNVTDDHDAGLGTSAEDMETHNPDIADYDKAIATMDAEDDDEPEDTSGGTVNTDDSGDAADASDADDKDDDKDKDGDDEARIPKSRLDEVIAQRDAKDKALNDLRVEQARDKAIFEGRLAALEKPEEDVAPVVDPLDDILKGEPQQVLDAFTEDPAAFIRMIQAQAQAKTTSDLNAEREEARYQKNLTAELDKFRDAHDDFMPNATKLVEVMNSNPIHNVISAYAYEIEIPALTAKLEEATQGVEDKITAAKTEGIAEGKKLAIKEIQAKGNASVLDGSSASQSGGKANTGIETDGDGTVLREKLTADLLKSRQAQG